MQSFTTISPTDSASLILVVCGVAYIIWAGNLRRKSKLPPGPMGLPLLGNVHQLPTHHQERTFADWSKLYGDLVFARLFRTPAVVINSLQVAKDLMEKRSGNYSGRPHFTLLIEFLGWDNITVLMTYGERFRKHQRWIHDAFTGKDVLEGYYPIQRRETCTLMLGLLESPERWADHLKRFSAALILDIAYGHHVTSLQDEFIEIANRATEDTAAIGSAGSQLVDFIPALKYIPQWMPGGGYKIAAAAAKRNVRRLLDTPYEMVKTQLESGTARPSFTATLLEEAISKGQLNAEEEEDIKGAAGVLFGAATDTTNAVLATFFLAMTLHPDIYKKAQEEVDGVIGPNRLPDFDDRDALPYLECILKELYRWNTPLPLGLPHSTMQADEYNGQEIPRGAMVIPNIWSMMHDEAVYPDPQRFYPERYRGLDDNAGDALDPRNAIFGFGRRMCPGRHFAHASVWLVAATIIATMDISKARDETGAEITPPLGFIPGFVSFRCDIRPRSSKVHYMMFEWSMGTQN